MREEAMFNFCEALKDNAIEVREDHKNRFHKMFEMWEKESSNYENPFEELYGDDFMYPGMLYSLVMEIVDEED